MTSFTDRAGRIPSVGDRVRVRFPDWRPSYWGRLVRVYESKRGLCCRVCSEGAGDSAPAGGSMHDVPADFVFRARDGQQQKGRAVMLANTIKAAAIKPCKARRGR